MNQTPPPHPDPTPSAHIQKDRVMEPLENMDNLLLWVPYYDSSNSNFGPCVLQFLSNLMQKEYKPLFPQLSVNSS